MCYFRLKLLFDRLKMGVTPMHLFGNEFIV